MNCSFSRLAIASIEIMRLLRWTNLMSHASGRASSWRFLWFLHPLSFAPSLFRVGWWKACLVSIWLTGWHTHLSTFTDSPSQTRACVTFYSLTYVEDVRMPNIIILYERFSRAKIKSGLSEQIALVLKVAEIEPHPPHTRFHQSNSQSWASLPNFDWGGWLNRKVAAAIASLFSYSPAPADCMSGCFLMRWIYATPTVHEIPTSICAREIPVPRILKSGFYCIYFWYKYREKFWFHCRANVTDRNVQTFSPWLTPWKCSIECYAFVILKWSVSGFMYSLTVNYVTELLDQTFVTSALSATLGKILSVFRIYVPFHLFVHTFDSKITL